MKEKKFRQKKKKQTQKSIIWQNELGEAQTYATEVRTDPFLIHHTKLTVIQGIYPTKRRKQEKKRKKKNRKKQ